MSEGNPGKDKDYDEKFDEIIYHPDGIEFFAKVSSFDAKRKHLYEELKTISKNIDEYTGDETDKSAVVDLDGIAEQLGSAMRALIESGKGEEDIADTIAWLMNDDVEERNVMMNEALGENKMIRFSQEQYCEIIEEILQLHGKSDEAVKTLIGAYHLELSTDVNKFIHELIHPDAEPDDVEDDVQEITLHKDLKEHIFDIGKIAAGMTIALMASRWMHRKS